MKRQLLSAAIYVAAAQASSLHADVPVSFAQLSTGTETEFTPEIAQWFATAATDAGNWLKGAAEDVEEAFVDAGEAIA